MKAMLTAEERELPMSLSVPSLSDAEFEEYCQRYSDFRLEYTSEGDLLVMPPTDPETGARCLALGYQLLRWSLESGGGIAMDSSTGFHLPDESRLSPDASWIPADQAQARPRRPYFVIEMLSPFDRRSKTSRKMESWIANGVQLAWMIEPDAKRVTIYRPGRSPEIIDGAATIRGEGALDSFVMDLTLVWKNY